MKITIFAAAILAVAAGAANGADNVLSNRDMQALFPGTFAGEFEGYQLVIRADSKGGLRGKAAGHYYDEGTWRVDGNRLCVSFNTWTGGKLKCQVVVKDGPWFKASSPDGSADLKLRRL
jgi:hypothetical protein